MQQALPIALIILDGFGYREQAQYNAIASANTPCWDRLWQTCPHTLLQGSGLAVGLPPAQMGNSEVGHMNLGLGRVVYQDFTRISREVEGGQFAQNTVFLELLQQLNRTKRTLHVLGLLSPGGIHSHESHIHALLRLAKEQAVTQVVVHAFLDGRDTPPKCAEQAITQLESVMQSLACGEIASLSGRYYAMDRDQRWDRLLPVYRMLTQGQAEYAYANSLEALDQAYQRGETDEFVQPTRVHHGKPPIYFRAGDGVIFMNFRADRARQLTQALVLPEFSGFKRAVIPDFGGFVTLTEYATHLPVSVAYPPPTYHNGIGEYLSQLGKSQLRIAETEKYAHVTFFFNGGVEAVYPKETRVLIPSPKVATYDLQPEMSAYVMTEALEKAIQEQKFDLIVCNFANADMVGHSGNFSATVKAIEVIDQCLSRIEKALQTVKGEMIITADHGNADLMFDETTNQPHTAHTREPVPFVYMGRAVKQVSAGGSLSDVAPTILHLMGLAQPAEMTGKSLLDLA